MLKIRIQYTNKSEIQQILKLLSNDYEILSLLEEAKNKNPKYANSLYKRAYIDLEKKEER